jgi:hypothetical protein
MQMTEASRINLREGRFSAMISSMALEMKQLSGADSGCAVSSGVEHFLDTEGVRGSNPLSRTILPSNHFGFNHPTDNKTKPRCSCSWRNEAISNLIVAPKTSLQHGH